MIAVIQCAAKKRDDAGCLVGPRGQKIFFVANPHAASKFEPEYAFARPDDDSGYGITWREYLINYNKNGENHCRLHRAFELYANPSYESLVVRLGAERVYVLSAGWGMIPANFLTPNYDITFSPNAPSHFRRRQSDPYSDYRLLFPDEANEEIVFFGGQSYVRLFHELTSGLPNPKVVFFNSSRPPPGGATNVRFATKTRTNWHYECVSKFLDRFDNAGQPADEVQFQSLFSRIL